MVVGELQPGQKLDLQLTLKIAELYVPVEEEMPVMIIWKRGQKQAPTKKKKINATVQNCIFNEKFQITTILDIGEDGKPLEKLVSPFSNVPKTKPININCLFDIVFTECGQ